MNIHRPLVALIMPIALLGLAACGSTPTTGGTHEDESAAMAPGAPPMEHASMALATVTPRASQTAANATHTPPAPVPARPSSAPNENSMVQVGASEFAFAVSQTTFAANTSYQFVIENRGVVPHEVVLLTPGEEHAHDDHGGTFAVSADELIAGVRITREQTFVEPGVFEIACTLPGHYEAGMKITITVE